MQLNPHQHFSREFKLAAVQRSLVSGKTASRVAAELGITAKRLYKWRHEIARHGEKAFPGKGQSATKPGTLDRLRRENERLRQERDFLKKRSASLPKKTGSIPGH